MVYRMQLTQDIAYKYSQGQFENLLGLSHLSSISVPYTLPGFTASPHVQPPT